VYAVHHVPDSEAQGRRCGTENANFCVPKLIPMLFSNRKWIAGDRDLWEGRRCRERMTADGKDESRDKIFTLSLTGGGGQPTYIGVEVFSKLPDLAL